MRLITIAAILFLLSGCAPAMMSSSSHATQQTQSKQGMANDLSGVWYFTDSTAKIKISVQDSRIVINAWDSSDGEKFVISDIYFDGKILRFTSLMPSTNWLVHNDCLIISDKEMQVSRSGASSQSSKLFKE